MVGQECVDFGGRGGQAGQVERYAADERGPVGFGRRAETLALEALEHEPIDGIPGPLLVADLRKLRALGWDERPVLFPPGALLDPGADEGDLLIAERRTAERHPHGRTGRGDALDDFALGRVAGYNGEPPAQVLLGPGLSVKPQLREPLGIVGAVAGIAFVRKDRPDIAIKLDNLGKGAVGRNLHLRTQRQTKQPEHDCRTRLSNGRSLFPYSSGIPHPPHPFDPDTLRKPSLFYATVPRHARPQQTTRPPLIRFRGGFDTLPGCDRSMGYFNAV